MAVDVVAEVVINRSGDDVARFAMNPNNDPSWIGGIKQVRVLTEPPLAQGSQVERMAAFLGKRIEYVMEVVEYEPNTRLVMRSIKGPFPMKVSYQFKEATGGTSATIRVQGDASGFYKLLGPVVSRSVKRNITKDLKALKHLMESRVDQS